jgi:hypothetical protein
VRARLPGLDLHEVEHLALAVEQEIVETEEDPGPLTKAPPRPRSLGNASAADGSPNVLDGAPGYVAEYVPAERGVDRNDVPPRLISRAPTGEPIERRLADGPRGSGGHHLLHIRATRGTGHLSRWTDDFGQDEQDVQDTKDVHAILSILSDDVAPARLNYPGIG